MQMMRLARRGALIGARLGVGTGARGTGLGAAGWRGSVLKSTVAPSAAMGAGAARGGGQGELRARALQFLKPLGLTACTVGASMALGDAICQSMDAGAASVKDTERTKMMWFIGTFISGPISHSFYVAVEARLPGSSMAVILKKTVTSSCFAFCVSLPVMFTAVTLLSVDPLTGRRSKTLRDARDKVSSSLLPTFAAGVCFWPFCNIVIFRFVPLARRAMVSSLIGLVWNIFLSGRANSRDAAKVGAAVEGGGDLDRRALPVLAAR